MRSLAESRRAFAALELAVRRRLAGTLYGAHQGLRLGPGSDPEEVVPYRPGEDDVRRIDWNVTARSTEPHVWRTRAEHEVETWVLVDETASMDFGTVEVEKGELAAWVTGAVGLLSDRPGNRLGVAHLGSDGVRWSPPLSPRRAAVRALSGHRPTGPPRGRAVPPTAVRAGLAGALSDLDARQRRRGARVVISDFVEPDGQIERPFAWEAPLRRLASRHDVLVVEVVDPRELDLPDVGPVVLLDPETGHRCEVWTSLPRLREGYAAAAAAHREAVAAAVRAAGAQHVVLRTDRDWVTDLVRFVRQPRHGAVRHRPPRRER
ncbi:MAG: DUF58 domain-containing protein [Marmoricola sp.]